MSTRSRRSKQGKQDIDIHLLKPSLIFSWSVVCYSSIYISKCCSGRQAGSRWGIHHLRLPNITPCSAMVAYQAGWMDWVQPLWSIGYTSQTRPLVDGSRVEFHHHWQSCRRPSRPSPHVLLHPVGVWPISWKAKGEMLSLWHSRTSISEQESKGKT